MNVIPAAAALALWFSAPAAAEPQPPFKSVRLTIKGPLETAMVAAVGRDVGPALTQVVVRTLVWWVRVPDEIRRGDKLDVLFEAREDAEPLVHAVRFVSGQTQQTHFAYRFQAPADSFSRFYLPNGEELEQRLKDAPLDDYEQVTSLLRDGRRHKGIDFKAPLGTNVRATFDGVISRKTWQFRRAGHSLEISDPTTGRSAMFLHLEPLPKNLKVGERVARGQVIAQAGNSGRSSAPHLHYQLVGSDGRVLDPFKVDPVYRRTLAPEHLPLLQAEIRRLDAQLGTLLAGN